MRQLNQPEIKIGAAEIIEIDRILWLLLDREFEISGRGCRVFPPDQHDSEHIVGIGMLRLALLDLACRRFRRDKIAPVNESQYLPQLDDRRIGTLIHRR